MPDVRCYNIFKLFLVWRMSTAQPTYNDILRLFQETDRQLKETALLLREKSLETDRKFQETDLQIKETNLQLKELGKQIGGLGSKFGSFTEGLALPSMEAIAVAWRRRARTPTQPSL